MSGGGPKCASGKCVGEVLVGGARHKVYVGPKDGHFINAKGKSGKIEKRYLDIKNVKIAK